MNTLPSRIILIILLFISKPAFSQTPEDYDSVMTRFKIFYNTERYDSLFTMYTDWDRAHISFDSFKTEMINDRYTNGQMWIIKYMHRDDSDIRTRLYSILTEYAGHRTYAIRLDYNSKIFFINPTRRAYISRREENLPSKN
ncbi:MAG: hypothetical protein WCG87_06965 [Bacteroidota bacterium]